MLVYTSLKAMTPSGVGNVECALVGDTEGNPPGNIDGLLVDKMEGHFVGNSEGDAIGDIEGKCIVQQKACNNWPDKCSMCDAIYDANPIPSSHVSLTLLEATELNGNTLDDLDGLEMCITDLNLEIATIKAKVDIFQLSPMKRGESL
eukprot:10324990-Ditylum_brightwellii.AAC.1